MAGHAIDRVARTDLKPSPAALTLLAVLAFGPAAAWSSPSAAAAPAHGSSDIPSSFARPTQADDYVVREVMIPMRDGVKLHTVIVIPKTAVHAPILLTRTPYDAVKRLEGIDSPKVTLRVPLSDEVFVADGYIRAFQDVRGKYGSQGDYVMNRPLVGPLNPTRVDHSTDTWDTIDWLISNLPQSNGKVGMLGTSYEGFTVLMGLVNPHPALKVAVAQSPMVDGWMGDDWYHHGAFRQVNLDYFTAQSSVRGEGAPITRATGDDYQNFLDAGSAGRFAVAGGLDQIPAWKRFSAHPAYDAFWRDQAMDRILAARPLTVPTMYVVGAWDPEDIYGAPHVYAALEPKDVGNDRNFLVIGPWNHIGPLSAVRSIGPVELQGDTAQQYRTDILKPFLDQYLKDGAPKADTPPVLAYDTGSNSWLKLPSWPVSCEHGCPSASRRLYLEPDFQLAFTPPAAGGPAYDEYVSDPAKPVPFVRRPFRMSDADVWRNWLVTDQRAVADRTDVLSYVTPALTAPVSIAGVPAVNLVAATSGTDADWVVKLIDVYPDQVPGRPDLGGYQLIIAADIFRGRYREHFDRPAPIAPDAPLTYRFDLPNAAHTFLPGHRIMVQIQSSWFPLYDRNPQRFVDNITFARPADYQKATMRIYRAGDDASFLDLPVVAGR